MRSGRPDLGMADLSPTGPADMTADGASGTPYPAFTPSIPQVENALSGPVLKNPKLVPIFFPQDLQTDELSTFVRQLLTSKAWKGLTEYGVLPGTMAPSVIVSTAAPATITASDIQKFMMTQINTNPNLPPPDANTLYLLHYPSTTVINRGTAMAPNLSCTAFLGYHDDLKMPDGTLVAFAVLARCSEVLAGSLTELESHEIFEGVTDPYIHLNPAFRSINDPYAGWDIDRGGSEIADLCEGLGDAIAIEPGVGALQRYWSNAEARALRNPCVPAPRGAYFNAVPTLNDAAQVSVFQRTRTTEAVKVPPGQTSTVNVRLFSNQPTGGPFSVRFVPGIKVSGPSGPTLSWMEAPGEPFATGGNGDTLHLQITAPGDAQPSILTFRLRSTAIIEQQTVESLWSATITIAPN